MHRSSVQALPYTLKRPARATQPQDEFDGASMPSYSTAGGTTEKDSSGDSSRRAPNIGESLNISVNVVGSGAVAVHLCQDRSPFTVEQWEKFVCQFRVVKGEIGGHNQWGGIFS